MGLGDEAKGVPGLQLTPAQVEQLSVEHDGGGDGGGNRGHGGWWRRCQRSNGGGGCEAAVRATPGLETRGGLMHSHTQYECVVLSWDSSCKCNATYSRKGAGTC